MAPRREDTRACRGAGPGPLPILAPESYDSRVKHH